MAQIGVARKQDSTLSLKTLPGVIRRKVGEITLELYTLLMSGVELVVDPIQRWIGIKRMGYLFLLPNMLIFGIFVLFPMMLNFYYSLTGGVALFPKDRTYVGLRNFETLAECDSFLDPNTCTEDYFWNAIFNTGFFVVTQVGLMVALSLLTALVLNREIIARGFFRSVFFYPVLLSPVVVALIWRWILQRNGVLNAILIETFGRDQPVLFLLEADWAKFWVVIVSVWAQMGFFTLILLAGLQSIPTILYEASEMDGANRWQSFRYVTMPLLMPTMFVVLVLSLIRAVQVFDQVFVLTGGGPGTATKYMVQYIYETGFTIRPPRRGLAAAASVVLGLVLLIFTLTQLWLGRKSEAA